MIEEYFAEMKDDFTTAISAFQTTLNTVRTGRASPVLLESVQIEVSSYNAKMGIKQLASITAP